MNNQLVEIVNLFHAYQSENPNLAISIADFCKHYLANEEIIAIEKHPDNTKNIGVEGELGRALGRMSRFSEIELKIVANYIQVDNIEEIWYLGGMFELQNPTKSDIIHYCISEFSSGIAVINRLLAKDFVEEYPDPQDKRAKRLRITPKGREKLLFAFAELDKMAKDIFLPLSADEKGILFQILSKLEQFHKDKHDKKHDK